MKKFFLKGLAVVAFFAASLTVNAQGTWLATTPTATSSDTMKVDTDLPFNIPNLVARNSNTVVLKGDASAPADGDFTNLAILQGSLNATFYAFKPAINGVLKVAGKYSANKTYFVFEATETDLATVAASGNLISADFTGTAVTATFSDGSTVTNGNLFAALTYTTMTFNVTAGKVYAVGVVGSKFQLRGVKYEASASIQKFSELEGVSIVSTKGSVKVNMKQFEGAQIEMISVEGRQISKKVAASSIETIETKGLAKGVYVVRVSQNGKAKTEKISIQ